MQAIETSDECHDPSAEPHDIEGGVASRFIETVCVDVPPALVAEQVKLTPEVSAVTLVESQPVEVDTLDSGSVTDQLTSTSPVCQPLVPSGPVTVASMPGGVESVVKGVTETLSPVESLL